MHTTYHLCREIMRRNNLTSGYGLSKLMGFSHQSTGRWLHKRGAFSTDAAIKCAELLSLNPAYTVACARCESEQTDSARKFWESLVDELKEPEQKTHAA